MSLHVDKQTKSCQKKILTKILYQVEEGSGAKELLAKFREELVCRIK